MQPVGSPTRMFSASIAGRRDPENVIVANEYVTHEEKENSQIIMLGLDSLYSDGNLEGSKLLIDSGAALSACPPQFCAHLASR